jgi:eukaryotic-like serine/threonine-protein kinase
MKFESGREWVFGEQIDDGGFGRVYAAKCADYDNAAAKVVPKTPGAEREMLFADLTGVRNIIPIIDRGESDDSYVLIMPRAEKSLLKHLTDVGSSLSISEAVSILTDIITSLVDLDGRVVHRDIKPANILLFNGNWCLSDFGIARYAAASTSPDTRKFAKSPYYAAPEQWRAEHATNATDVYAFGIIGYELLSGALPFTGPSEADLRNQHLNETPAPLSSAPALLVALVEECLYKAQGARPSPSNILARLAKAALKAASPGLAQLQDASDARTESWRGQPQGF